MEREAPRTAISPEEFRQRSIEIARQKTGLDLVSEDLAKLRKQAHPAVRALYAPAYYVPLALARRFYLATLESGRQEMMHTLVNLSGECLLSGLSAGAKDALKVGDWWMIGWLCLRVDLAATSYANVDPAQSPSEDGAVPQAADDSTYDTVAAPSDRNEWLALFKRFEQLLLRLVPHSGSARWAQAVRGYLLSFPAGFLPPSDLADPGWNPASGGSEGCGTQLLRLLVDVPCSSWHADPTLLADLGQADFRFTVEFSARCASSSIEKSEATPCDTSSELARTGEAAPPRDNALADDFDVFIQPEDEPSQFDRPVESDDETPADPGPVSRWRRMLENAWIRKTVGIGRWLIRVVGAAPVIRRLLRLTRRSSS